MKKATYYKRFDALSDVKPKDEPEQIDFIKLKNSLKKSEKRSYENMTFESLYTPEQLTKKRDSLINEGFISPDTGQNQFINIFTGQLITSRIKPIKWMNNKESLRFFLETLIPGLILHRKQVENCFVDKNGRPVIIAKPNRTKPIKHDTKLIIQEIIFQI